MDLRGHGESDASFDAYLGDHSGPLALARPLEDLAILPLAPQAAFLVSRIDGLVSIEDLFDVCGMHPVEARRYLCQLLILGILR